MNELLTVLMNLFYGLDTYLQIAESQETEL